jgi:peptide/nickel transport system permease protein
MAAESTTGRANGRRAGADRRRWRLALTRVLLIFPILFAVSVLIFEAGRLTLRNASISALGFFATPEAKAAFNARFHLNEPLVTQYLLWLRGAIHGDFGDSLITRTPVSQTLQSGFIVTFTLALGAMVIAGLAGFGLGTLGGLGRPPWLARLISSGSLFGVSVPQFWLGLVLLLIFAVRLGLLPGGGYVPFTRDPSGFLRSMLLPWITLAVAPAGVVARVTQVRVAEESVKPHVLTARSLGVSRPRIVRHYIQRNALAEPLTVFGIQVGYMLGGAFLVEQVFNLPGLGQIVLTAVRESDYPIVQAVALYTTLAFVLVSLAVDVLLLFLDVRAGTS